MYIYIEVVRLKSKYLRQKLNLKTGFFKKEKYILTIDNHTLKIISTTQGNKKIIEIKTKDIKTISISKQTPCEIEIRTFNTVYLGTFPIEDDISGLLIFLQTLLDERLICY